MPEFEYRQLSIMPPRPGIRYSTKYYKQSAKQREILAEHIRDVCDKIGHAASDADEIGNQIAIWLETPDERFTRDRNRQEKPGKYKTPLELLEDSLGEANGRKANGDPKDFAQAPIERWNKLFENDPEFQIIMVTERPKNYNPSFEKLFKRG